MSAPGRGSAGSAAGVDAAHEAWRLLFELFTSLKPRLFAIASEFELAPMQVHALRLLAPDEPLPMSALADALHCDASNVTGIVDRLEARGLIERQGAERDRRVKMLVVTPEGAAVRDRVLERLAEPPAAIADLPVEDQRDLCEILGRALGLARPE